MLVRRVPKVSVWTLQVAPRQAVHVVQHEPRVAVHRAGDVEQDDDRRQLAPRPAEARHERLGLARHGEHRRAQVDPAARARFVAAPAHRRERQRHFLGELLGELELGRGHRFEVGALQALAVGEGEAGLELDRVVGLVRRPGGVGDRRRRERVGEAVASAACSPGRRAR